MAGWWWRDNLTGEVVGGEVTCGGEMVGGESSWWRDDLKPINQSETLFGHISVTFKE